MQKVQRAPAQVGDSVQFSEGWVAHEQSFTVLFLGAPVTSVHRDSGHSVSHAPAVS